MKLVTIHKRGHLTSCEELEKPCCETLAKWWGSIFQLHNGKPHLCILSCDYGDHEYDPEEEITHCPFCGTKIELETEGGSS